MLHGTRHRYAHRISEEGLYAGGGDPRSNRRVHIHLVKSVDGRNRIPGVRPGSDVVVHVNIKEFMQAGGECWWARDGCLLTEGLQDPEHGNIGIPPRFFVGIVDRYTGRPVVSLPTPRLTDRGDLAPGQGVPVAQIVITENEAQRILRQVAFL